MPRTDTATARRADLAGLDRLETVVEADRPALDRAWSAVWPKLAAVAIFLGGWQLVVWSGWREEWLLPGPLTTLDVLWSMILDGSLAAAGTTTLSRAAIGFSVSVLLGSLVGLVVASIPLLRIAVGSLITGVQTMPSIAWFPLAILLFQLTEQAILFVVVLGAAPAIANGLLHGIDHTPPLLNRAGRVLGARGLDRYRFIVLPAALPGFVGGLKQGWAFAWRSLMAGELLVIIGSRPSLGAQLHFAREFSQPARMLANMLVILLIGIVVDAVFFGRLESAVKRRWGLTSTA
jgi:NitT/TauT family transport system permease protein